MAQPFKLPDLGEGIHEGEVVAVLVSEGDRVAEGQPILEVETDKAAVQIPCPFSGTIQEIRVKPNDLVRVGSVMMTFDERGTAESTDASMPVGAVAADGHEGNSRAVLEGSKLGIAERLSEQLGNGVSGDKTGGHAGVESEGTATPGAGQLHPDGPVPASPATRRLAREMGVNLRLVPGSGPAGLVTAGDVRAFAARAADPVEAPTPEPFADKPQPGPSGREAAPALPDFGKWGPVERTPLRSVRRTTAQHMALSWSQIPHVNHQDVADITLLEEFRRRQAGQVEAMGGKLTLTVLVMKAAVAALKAYPGFNSSLDTSAQEIILKRYYHLGIAADTERGLIVPVIRDVDRKSIVELAIEMKRMAERARAGKTSLEEMQGGTFTITNIGALGGTGFAAIINHPQVAILGMGRAKLQPVVLGDLDSYEIVPRLMLPLVLAFDHRVMDGADAARFVGTIKDSLENPDRLWLRM
jgi:pyruvate dehydrogenase E2 component (dihydrolipoamide acetyltransferase)